MRLLRDEADERRDERVMAGNEGSARQARARQDAEQVLDEGDHLETRLARFKVPRYRAFVDSLPMTASERVAKPQLSREIGLEVVDLQHVVRKPAIA